MNTHISIQNHVLPSDTISVNKTKKDSKKAREWLCSIAAIDLFDEIKTQLEALHTVENLLAECNNETTVSLEGVSWVIYAIRQRAEAALNEVIRNADAASGA